jgi:2-octaprenylphenol hydroxylase
MVVWDATGRPGGAGSLRFSAAESGEPDLGFIVENRRVLWSLYEAPAFRTRVTLLRAELAALSLENSQATVTLSDGRVITAGLVVGADGAASLSRKLAGIETGGWDYEQSAFVTHLRTAHPHERTAWQRFLPSGPLAFLPLVDGRSSIVWTTTPQHADHLVTADPEVVAGEISGAMGNVFGEIRIAAPRAKFPLRLSFARDYCKPRFVLVGDAAHSVHPLAGQGVNLGFMDCAALVQVLSESLAAGGSAGTIAEQRVLRRYERWRKSENLLALGLIDGINRLFSNSSEPLTQLRRFGLSAVNRSLLLKRLLMGRAMGTAGELPVSARARL